MVKMMVRLQLAINKNDHCIRVALQKSRSFFIQVENKSIYKWV
jgi:hypothetical protein